MRPRISLLTACFVCLVCLACFAVRDCAAGEAKTEPLTLEAGPIWDNDHAKERCPEVLAEWLAANPGREAVWTGHWNTTIQNEMSVCHCEETVSDADDDGDDDDAYWAEREVAFKFGNNLPIEVRKIRVISGGKTFETAPGQSLLTGQTAAMTATVKGGLDAIVFETSSADFVFNDLSRMPKSDKIQVAAHLSGEGGALECVGADGDNASIEGTADIFAPEDEMSDPMAFSEVLDAESIASVREDYLGTLNKTRHGFALWISFAGEKWLAMLKPEDFDADRDSDESAVRAEVIDMHSPNHYADLDDTFDAIQELGFRPWAIWSKLDLGETEGVAGLTAADYDVSDLADDDDAAMWTRVKEEMGEKEFPRNRPWVVKALFVTKDTFDELKAGQTPSSRPVILLRRDNGIFYGLEYFRDGRPLLEKLKK